MVVVGIRVLNIFLGVSGATRACLKTGYPGVGIDMVFDALCMDDVGASLDLDRFIGVS